MSRLPHLGWSSHVYPLEAADIAALSDYVGDAIPSEALPQDEIIVFIRPDGPDVLLRGRDEVEAARTMDPRRTVPVRIVFKPSVAKWNLLATLVRVFRNRHRYHGTGIYHVSAGAIRRMGLERTIRSVDNPQLRKNVDRKAYMIALLESLRSNGYDETRPMNIMLCRTGGARDSLRQGHHRVSACLTVGVDRVVVSFSAAGALPAVLGRRWQGVCT